jgi:peptidoglycan/xylan/chitin deacetylase (PgdA/CDA1 family)
MSSVSVLMYHALESAGQPAGARDAGEQRYVLHVDRFREQMEFLHREGFKTFLLGELIDLEKWPDKAVVLTFDDGHESNFRSALPILLRYGFFAEFFVTTGFIGKPHYMTTNQVKALSDAGMGIGSHGLSHKYFDDMNGSEIEHELRNSMELLTRITGRKVVSFSAPGGRLPSGARVVAEDLGYRIICTSQPGVLNRQHPVLHNVPRLALQSGTDMETYKMMIRGKHNYVNRLIWRNNCLYITKKLLGNKVYEDIRQALLRNT